MADVFISYSRKDAVFVRRLHDQLSASGRDSWVDWEDIPPTAQWLSEIYTAIEAADAFAFVISPDSLASPVCQQEIEHAVLHNKRFIPLLHRPPEPGTPIHPAISSHNWIYFREDDPFEAAFQTLMTALDTDLAYVRAHTRLLVRAREWASRGQDASYLLRGEDLADAETWLREGGGKQPDPTDLHTTYILTSRQAANTRQRLTVGALTGGLLLALLLAAFALLQWNAAVAAQNIAEAETQARATAQTNAEQQARIAQSGRLAAQALNQLRDRPDLALILSVQGYQLADTLEARRAMLSALVERPQLIAYLRDHQDSDLIRSVAASPDGRMIASGDEAGNLILWDAASGERLFPRLFAHLTDILALAFSPDGTRLYSADLAGNLMIWDTASGARVGWPREQGSRRTALLAAFSPDADTVALFSPISNTITLIDSQTGAPRGEPLRRLPDLVRSLAFSPDGQWLAAVGLNGQVRVWSVMDGALRDRTFSIPDSALDAAVEITFSPDGRQLALATVGQLLTVWDFASGDLIGTVDGEAGQFATGGLTYSPDGALITVGTQRGELVLVSTLDLSIRAVIPTHTSTLKYLAFVDASRLVTASQDGTLALLDLANPGPLVRLIVTGDDAAPVVYSPDGVTLAGLHCRDGAGGPACHLAIWDAQTGEQVSVSEASTPLSWRGMAYSPDGARLAVMDADGQIQRIDSATLRPVGEALALPSDEAGVSVSINALTFSPDGRWLAASGMTDTPLLWDLTTDQRVEVALAEASANALTVWSVAFSPDSCTLALGGLDGEIMLLDVQTLQATMLGQLADFSMIGVLAFSPDGRTLAAGARNSSITLWDVATGRMRGQPLTGHTLDITSLAFDPTGAILASASAERRALLWDVATGQPFAPSLSIPDRGVIAVAFSPDGGTLALSSNDQISLLDLASDNWPVLTCQRARLNLRLPEWERLFPDTPYTPVCPAYADGLADLTQWADSAALRGEADRAHQLFTSATAWAVQTRDDSRSRALCHYGVVNGFAAVVLPACDHAVALNPTYGPRYSDRGIARALAGDSEGAIADFEFFLAWLPGFQAENGVFFGEGLAASLGAPREAWVAALRAGENPFDAEALAALRE